MANTYLTRTATTPTNNKKLTISLWCKRSGLDSSGTIGIIGFVNPSNAQTGTLQFRWKEDTFTTFFHSDSTTRHNLVSSAKHRDVNGWYHCVMAVDTTQATASNRVKMYINGEQITSFASSFETYPAQDTTYLDSGDILQVGRITFTGGDHHYLDGSLSHVHFCDGYAYAASDFGSTDATTGEWKINTNPNVTYGTNGFFILKDGNSVTDQSPNTNNFTVAGGTLTKTEDCPSSVFATLNPLGGRNGSGKGTYQNGNTTWISSSTDQDACNSTLAVNDGGQYYCEMKCVAKTGGYYNPGVFSAVQSVYNSANPSVFVRGDGIIYNNGSQTQSGLTSVSNGDIIGMAYDGSGATHTIQFYLNGSTYGSSENITNTPGYPLFFGDGTNSGSVVNEVNFNFGNGYFGTTAVSSAGTNASNNGIFEYDVPTGYTALSTKGLNL